MTTYNYGYSSKQLSARGLSEASAVKDPLMTYQLGSPRFPSTSWTDSIVSRQVADTSVIPRTAAAIASNSQPVAGTPLVYRPAIVAGGQNVNTLYQGGLMPRYIQTSGKGFEPYSASVNVPGGMKSEIASSSRDPLGRVEGGGSGYGNSYNETAFDGPYLKTRYDMGGVPTSRVFGVDYPYNLDQNPDLASQVKSGALNASQYFDAVMKNNRINDVDQIMSSSFRFTNAPNVSFSAGFGFTY